MKKAMLIVNPSSGKEEAVDHVEQIEHILSEKGYEVEVAQTEKEFDATKYCQNACRGEFDLVVSMGGDGTLHETINGMVDESHRPRLGIIPLGTVNDFARALDIPLKVEEAIDVLRSDQTKSVDIGKFNDQYFVNIVAVGALAEATYEVTPEQKTKFGPLAYMMEGMKTLTQHSSYPMRIEYDDKAWEGESFLFLAALTNSAGGFEKLSPEAKVNDGKIHGYIVPKVNMIRLASIVSAILRGGLKDEQDVEYFKADHIRITSEENLVTNVDGEEGDSLPVELSVLPSHISVVVK
ncbi:diacylglycerol/lipid kinase family protein [Halobacillus trueperi]|uniref:Diacylglycerol kinase family lipid kinase n=1 Tax=Halobacillus trueperi TaxID=156205 RepID=A0A3E0J0U7_9BACI|nr:YegS/Rv2252/BmrU family lipid kinase [Halobacillus trueperi]REJ06459.1 diacylglycerol kinase family lipid kinase [Halobacillus trueperi]